MQADSCLGCRQGREDTMEHLVSKGLVSHQTSAPSLAPIDTSQSSGELRMDPFSGELRTGHSSAELHMQTAPLSSSDLSSASNTPRSPGGQSPTIEASAGRSGDRPLHWPDRWLSSDDQAMLDSVTQVMSCMIRVMILQSEQPALQSVTRHASLCIAPHRQQ
jgi:hypothetical protein